MRTTLTIEQSAELIKRGVSEAIVTTLVPIVNDRGFTYKHAPILTLDNLLSLLPKHIPLANAEWYLNIQWDILDNKWHVQYLDFDHDDEVVKEEEAPELIDALYMLTLAVINHVKLD